MRYCCVPYSFLHFTLIHIDLDRACDRNFLYSFFRLYSQGYILSKFTIMDLNRIIERDATNTSYKYALLRATSSIAVNHSPMIIDDCKVCYSTGFLVEKWIEYYYPVIDSETFIPQKNAEKEHDKTSRKIAFRGLFKQLTDFYRPYGGFKAFWNDYKRGTINPEVNVICLDLAKSIWYTITRYPMKHLGYSVTGKHYSFYGFTKRSRIPQTTSFSQETLLHHFGSFSLENSFHQILRTLGDYISGEYSILKKWIEFTVKADTTGAVKPQYIYQILNTSPEEERDVHDSQMFFKDLMSTQGSLECTWTGRRITSPEALAIDHAIPFSVWRNNDLWNLLPTHSRVNMHKRDMIPSDSLLEERRDLIISYWETLLEGFCYRFSREVKVSLMDGCDSSFSLDYVFNSLVDKCRHLIEVRGLPTWSYGAVR